MFEAAEVGHAVSRTVFRKRVPQLRTQLVDVQLQLAKTNCPVILIVAGMEGAGISRFVNRLVEWLDPRHLQTSTYWDESAEERSQSPYWRYWRHLPPGGKISVQYGCWYNPPLLAGMQRRMGAGQLDLALSSIQHLERMLADDGALIIKLWFHISRREQKQRLRQAEWKPHGVPKALYAGHAGRFRRVAETIIRATDQGYAPWHIIDACDAHYRDLAAGGILLNAIRARLKRPDRRRGATRTAVPKIGRMPSVLDSVDLSSRLPKKKYETELTELQAELGGLFWKAREQRRSLIAVFEGWDAAGKGGAIRRVAAGVDARLLRVIQIGAPTDEERRHHYLWRFGRQLPRPGSGAIFDRSWYGRVLVERVDGLASPTEWGRAYAEINDFEQGLVDHGSVLCKFWLHISAEEQLRRFRERERVPYKRYKITAEDWHNRDRRAAYLLAVDEMVARTSTAHAPWTLVPADSKYFARIDVLKTLIGRLERALKHTA